MNSSLFADVIHLTADGVYALYEVVELLSIEVAGPTDSYFNYHNFKIYAQFNTGNGIEYGYINGATCLSLQECEECPTSAFTVSQNDTVRAQRLASGEFFLDESISRYNSYTAAIDTFNISNNLTPADSTFLVAKPYNYFSINGFDLPAPSYVRYLANAIVGMDSLNFLSDPDKFVSIYGYGTNVLFEYQRYTECITRYNVRANQLGASSLLSISKVDFVNSRVAIQNGEYLTYIESQPVGNQAGLNILAYFNVTPTAFTSEQLLYKQYTDTYLQFETDQATNSTCPVYKLLSPMYAYEDIDENNLFCSTEGQQKLVNYTASFTTGGCPDRLPNMNFCSALSSSRNKRANQKLYILYKEAIKEYNGSFWAIQNGDSLSIDFVSVNDFSLSDVRFCIEAYLTYLKVYSASTDSTQPAAAPVSISEFGPCVGELQPEVPCKDAYIQYIDCIRSFNDWAKINNYPYFYNEVAEYETFLKLDMCYCIDEFCARLNEIKDGLVTFNNADLFFKYLSFRTFCEKPCTPLPQTGLPAEPIIVEVVDDCLEMQINQALFTAQLNYDNYINELTNQLVELYDEHCLTIEENLAYEYNDKLYHFTLYYYDQAGNLIKTIPPEGVETVNTTNSNDAISLQIAADRTTGTKTVFTNHRLATRYEYNSLNQLVTQSSPDTDPMHIFEITLPNGLNAELVTQNIQMVTENRGYLAGEVNGRGMLYQTNDGGVTWNRVYGLIGSDLKKAVMIDQNIGFAIGTSGIVLRTIDGGNTWDMLDFWSMTNESVDLNDILYYQNGTINTIIIVGNKGLVAKSTDFNNFTLLNNNIDLAYDITSVTTDGNRYYVTANGNQTATIYRNLINANNWQESDKFKPGKLRTNDFTSSNRVIAAGNDGRIFINNNIVNTANRWQMIETNVAEKITDIQFFNDLQGVAIVDEYLYRTNDGGKNWTQFSNKKYKHLSEDGNSAVILAVGKDAQMDVFVPTNNLNTQSIPVASNLSPNPTVTLTAGWIKKDVNDYIIFSALGNRQIAYTFNGQNQIPIWSSIDLTQNLQPAERIIDIKAKYNNATNFKLIVLTNNNRVFRVKKAPNNNTITITLLGVNYKAIAHQSNSNIFFAFKANGNIQKASINGGNLSFFGNGIKTTSTIVKGQYISTAGNKIGRIRVNSNSVIGVNNQTKKTNPVALSSIDYHAVDNRVRVTGIDGTLYEKNNGWKLIRTATNKNLYASIQNQNELSVVGESGYFTTGLINGTQFNGTPEQLTTGQTAESMVNEDLFAITINQNRTYAVGENGRVLYSPNPSLPYAKLTHGTKNLYGATNKLGGSTSVFVVGEDATLNNVSGASFIQKKDLFTPPLTDVNFSSSNIGAIVADNFTVRTTTDAGITWNTTVPDVLPVTANYSHIWNVNANKTLVFGEALPYESIANSATTISAGPTQVTDLDQLNTTLYIANTTQVVKMNLSVNTFTTSLTLSQQANAIKVLADGSYGVAGENGLFNYYNNSNSLIYAANPSIDFNNADLNDFQFVDNSYIVVVGDDGAYFKTDNPSIDANGYLTSSNWASINVYSPDPVLQNNTDANIYTIAFSSPTNGIYAGEYNLASNPNLANVPIAYARAFFDPNARYSSRFFYDKLGRLVVSQNARQFNATSTGSATIKFSYTLYDNLGRVVEVGEKTDNPDLGLQFNSVFGTMVSNYYNPSVMDDTKLLAWINGTGNRKEVTKSYYDETVIAGLPTSFSPNLLTQRKRIIHVTYEAEFDGDDQTYDHATHYDYDIHGNVKTLLQDNQKMALAFASISDQRYKRMDYTYDLVSGNVHRMSVQNGEIDQWHHAYRYDADNRIIAAFTNDQTPILDNSALTEGLENELLQNTDWQQDARYFYYDHGPLARTEVGNDQLQGCDYVYNLQGWLKGVNATSLDKDIDPGKDGLIGNANEPFANDIYAFGLTYFENDYQPIDNTNMPNSSFYPVAQVNATSHAAQNSSELFNGNIRFMQTTLSDPTTYDAMPMLNAYQYDQLNRLLRARSYETGITSNEWNPTSYGNSYFNEFTYDAMGNILTQDRRLRNGTQIEEMTYGYSRNANGELLRNRLYHINDAIASTVDDTDIDDMGTGFIANDPNIESNYNYTYDEEGRLIKDVQENIQIEWRVDGKVKKITRITPNSEQKNVSFDYDAMGNRIAKHIHNSQTEMLEKSTYYILDAQGNTLNTYDHEVDASVGAVYYTLKERQIYGSSRLGIYDDSVSMYNSTPSQNISVELGHKYYEFSNHLGNVLTVINDVKTPTSTTGLTVDGCRASIVNIADYSPFGVLLDGRTVSSDDYRYSFQGQEADDEIKGKGNSYTTLFRQYDPRIGRWLTLDPKMNKYPFTNPYNAFMNNPMIYTDPKGDDVFLRGWKRKERSELIRQLELTTGLDLKVGLFGKLKYKKDKTGSPIMIDNSSITAKRPISLIAQSRLKSMIDDHCSAVHVSGKKGENTGVIREFSNGYEDAKGRWATKSNINYKEIKDINDNGTNLGQSEKRSLGVGMVFFHETDHQWTDSQDEWQMGTINQGLGEEIKSSGVLLGSASDFTNSIRIELNIPERLTYSIRMGNQVIIPLIRSGAPQSLKNKTLNDYLDGTPPSGAKYGSKEVTTNQNNDRVY